MPLDPEVLPRSLRFAAIGAGVGAVLGVVRSFQSDRKHTTESQFQQSIQGILTPLLNIKHFPDAEEVLRQMSEYRHIDREAYTCIQENLDRLLGLYIQLTNGQGKASYAQKADRYRFLILECVRKLVSKVGHLKQFQEDAQALEQLLDAYVSNINTQTTENIQQMSISS